MNNDWPDPPKRDENSNESGKLSPLLIGGIGCALNFLVPAFTLLSATSHTVYPPPFGLTFFVALVSLITGLVAFPQAFTWKFRNSALRTLAIALCVLPLFVGIGSLQFFAKITGIIFKN